VGIVGRTRTFFGRHGAKMALGALFGLLFIAALGSVVFIGPLGEGVSSPRGRAVGWANHGRPYRPPSPSPAAPQG
jgi:hypothetical protein